MKTIKHIILIAFSLFCLSYCVQMHLHHGEWSANYLDKKMVLEISDNYFNLLTVSSDTSLSFNTTYTIAADTICLLKGSFPKCHTISFTKDGHLKLRPLGPSQESIEIMNLVEFERYSP